MQLKVKLLGLHAGRPVAIMHPKTAQMLDVHVDERIEIKRMKDNSKSIIAVVDLAPRLINQEEIIVSSEVAEALKIKKGELVNASIAHRPESIYLIHRKLDCERLKLHTLSLLCIIAA